MPPIPPPPVEHHPAPSGGRGGDVYQKIGWLDLINRGIDAARGFLPEFSHSIQVAVVGGPTADIRRIWYLCVSAAFGRFRNRVRTALVSMEMAVTWDITAKVVSIELNYTANALTSITAGGRGDVGFADPGGCGVALIARGPEQLTVGAGFNSVFNPAVDAVFARRGPPLARGAWRAHIAGFSDCVQSGRPIHVFTIRRDGEERSATAPGNEVIRVLRELPVATMVNVPGSMAGLTRTTKALSVVTYPYTIHSSRYGAVIIGATGVFPGTFYLPRLPDEGRVITTNEKLDDRVQPPKPYLDGSTRGSFLALVAQSLQEPCFLPTSPPCTGNIAGTTGLYVTKPDSPNDASAADLAALWSGRASFDGTYPGALGAARGPDGYPLPAPNEYPNYGN